MIFCYWHEKEKIQRYNRIFHLSKISDDRGKTPKIFRRQARIFIFYVRDPLLSFENNDNTIDVCESRKSSHAN